jgi:hypothetical protein
MAVRSTCPSVNIGQIRDIAMREPAQVMHIEPRWPVALASILLVVLLNVLPGRLRVLPNWASYLAAIALIVPMAALSLSTAKARWLHIESIVILLFLAFTVPAMIVDLNDLFAAMLRPSGAAISGLRLLASSVAVWATNVLVFSLVYWRLDRGGPEARAGNASTKPDWLFPQNGAPEGVPPDWRATFVDYLFLAFCTATAFSAGDASPLTSRAKLLMMSESIISLVTIIAVAARAINILGS